MGVALSVLDDTLRERARGSSDYIAAKEIIATPGDEACLQLGMLADVAQDILQLQKVLRQGALRCG